MDSRRNYVILIITVISLGLFLTGGTYAFLTFGATVDNNTITGDTTCFIMNYAGGFSYIYDLDGNGNIDSNDGVLLSRYARGEVELPEEFLPYLDYDNDGEITESDGMYLVRSTLDSQNYPRYDNSVLYPSNTDKGGVVGMVTLKIADECDVNAVGYIKFNIGEATNSKYLANNVLGYSVYASDKVTKISDGFLTSYGDKILNSSNPVTLSKTPTTYYVYIWLNGNKIDNSYLNLPFSGYLHASATQIES